MKAIQRNILISLVPLLTPLPAFSQTPEKVAMIAPIPNSQGTASTWRATQVIGQNVKNAGDETIGEVEDLLVDMKSGEIHAVIVSAGGFLGIGDVLTAVPVSALRFDNDAKAFKTKLTKEQLEKAPQFKTTSWPDHGDIATIHAMRSYRDSIDGDVTEPDNSTRNEKPQNKDGLIPTDQGNSEKDVQITRNIRTSIIDTDLSFNAKNIKIITKDERVVLKGGVENDDEHQVILKIAKDHVNATKITDELKVHSK